MDTYSKRVLVLAALLALTSSFRIKKMAGELARGGEVRLLQTPNDFNSLLENSEEKLIVVDFYATWCAPCMEFAPLYARMAEHNPGVIFAKVDVDNNNATAEECGVTDLPTLQLFKNNDFLERYTGTNAERELRKLIAKHKGTVPNDTNSAQVAQRGTIDNPWHLIIAGGGPAGTGPLLNAAAHGRSQWDDLMEMGVAVFERSEYLVSGAFGDRHGTSTSHGYAFQEIAVNAASVLPKTRAHPWIERLKTDPHPDFDHVSNFLRDMGAELAEVITATNGKSRVHFHHSVRSCQWTGDLWRVSVHDDDLDVDVVHYSRWLLMATGGKDRVPDPIGRSPVKLTDWARDDPQHRQKIVPGSEVIWNPEDYRAKLTMNQPKVVVIGGAHGAWLIVDILAELPGTPIDMTVIRRSPTRIYNETVEQMRKEGRSCQPGDICPLTGRVNRQSGVRGSPRQRVIDMERSGTSAGLASLRAYDGDDEEKVERLLNEADLVIYSVGFGPNFPPVLDAEGAPAHLKIQRNNGMVMRKKDLWTPVWQDSDVKNIIMYGIGAGLPCGFNDVKGTITGGEARLHGKAPVDSIWLYENDIGAKVTKMMRESFAETSSKFERED
jgi:thioredoxin 1